MAMDQPDSSSTGWAQPYRRSSSGGLIMLGQTPLVSNSIEITAAGTGQTASGSTTSTASGYIQSNMGGRVARPTRKRSRASRRVPTTLLNTDTTNFRAMVQQFTGIPSTPYTSGPQDQGVTPVINFGLGFNERVHQGSTVPYGHVHYLQQYQEAQQSCQPSRWYQLPQQSSVVSIGNNPNEIFLQGSSNQMGSLENSGGFFLDTISGQMIPRSSSTDNKTHGYHP